MAKRYSYSSTRMGLTRRLAELYRLLQVFRGASEARADMVLHLHQTARKRIEALFGRPLRGVTVLDLGPGQQLLQMRCFSVENDVVGIDTDVMPQGFSLRDYVEMLRVNSGVRVLKTLGRKALGFDRGLERALARRLGVPGFSRFDVRRMDACRMTFDDSSFDVVHSHSVFEHIADPGAALREVRRVLRPGGVAYLSVHIYTSHSGAHDPAVMARGRPEPPLWPHLRPAYQASVHPSTYLNEVRLSEWKGLFEENLPGVSFVSERQDELIGALQELRTAGELRGYADDELLTLNFIGLCRK